jgi:hypothetical protein
MRRALPGVPHPLGATPDADGVNFAIFSENARALELCLFDENERETRLPLRNQTAYVWHAYVPGLPIGTRYGYRAYGDYAPARGHRFNPVRYSMASEVQHAGRRLERIASVNRRWRDFTLVSLTRALIEVLAVFPVYRTYLREGRPPSEHDERCVRQAIRAATIRRSAGACSGSSRTYSCCEPKRRPRSARSTSAGA